MEGLTWKMLATPEYVMVFIQGFLTMFVPGIAGGNALDSNTVVEIAKLPSAPVFLIATCAGLLNGIVYLRNLRAPAPMVPGVPGRRASDSPSPGAGGS